MMHGIIGRFYPKGTTIIRAMAANLKAVHMVTWDRPEALGAAG